MFIRVHINSYIKVSLFRVKTIKAPMSHFWNVDFDLPNTFIKKLSFRVVATFNFFRNSSYLFRIYVKLLWLPVPKRKTKLSDLVLDKLLNIATTACNWRYCFPHDKDFLRYFQLYRYHFVVLPSAFLKVHTEILCLPLHF